jgi:23S rRNA (adenine2503-C2)-methyltransferase
MTHLGPRPVDLLNLTHDELQRLLSRWGEPEYRADQVWNWLYVHLASHPHEMTNLPKDLRSQLAAETYISGLQPVAQLQSSAGETTKWLFELRAPRSIRGIAPTAEKAQVETVLMRYESRRTACVSSQAGCGMGCTFCATGQMGLQRNLTAGEIVGQVLFVARQLAERGEHLTNLVLMGMGEPLANYGATLDALRRLIDPDGFNLGQRRITVSTVGLVPGIERFAREGLQIGLAVSLHAATDELRETMVPINRQYPLDRLMAACRYYAAHTGRRISFEWALINGVNDGVEQAETLAQLVQGMLCHVNLIPLNPTSGYGGQPAAPARVAAFRGELERHGVPTTVRVRRGIDIQAGCGQLRERHAEAPGIQ